MHATRGSTRRPTRAVLERLIRETGGSMTRLAQRLGVTRQTAYTWTYQLDLARVVGIRAAEPEGREEVAVHDERKRQPATGRREGRVSVTMNVDGALWKHIKIRAIEDDTTTGAIVEAAVRPYLAAPREPRP